MAKQTVNISKKDKENYKLIAINEMTNIKQDDNKQTFSPSITLKITNQFFDKYMKNKLPTPHINIKNTTNAYVYGKLYKKGNVLIGHHDNDIASTGAYDITDGVKFNGEHVYNYCMNIAKKTKKYDWFNPELLQVIKTFYPEILFIGDTYGGDVGASIYVHLDDNKEIDSIIIDNHYFY